MALGVFKVTLVDLNINIYLRSVLFYVILALYSIIGSRYIEVDNSYQEDMFAGCSHTGIITIFLFGALLETFIFNFLIICILRIIKFFRRNDFLLVILSSIIFGLGHFSSIGFVIVTFFAGEF